MSASYGDAEISVPVLS